MKEMMLGEITREVMAEYGLDFCLPQAEVPSIICGQIGSRVRRIYRDLRRWEVIQRRERRRKIEKQKLEELKASYNK